MGIDHKRGQVCVWKPSHSQPLPDLSGFLPDDVSAVSEARFHDKVGGEAGDVARVRYSR